MHSLGVSLIFRRGQKILKEFFSKYFGRYSPSALEHLHRVYTIFVTKSFHLYSLKPRNEHETEHHRDRGVYIAGKEGSYIIGIRRRPSLEIGGSTYPTLWFRDVM